MPLGQPLHILVGSNEIFVIEKIVEKIKGKEFEDIFHGSFPFTYAVFFGERPAFTIEEAIKYLRNTGYEIPKMKTYMVYVGTDIKEVNDRGRGVELPSFILENPDVFREEFFYRIRRIVGSPRDN